MYRGIHGLYRLHARPFNELFCRQWEKSPYQLEYRIRRRRKLLETTKTEQFVFLRRLHRGAHISH